MSSTKYLTYLVFALLLGAPAALAETHECDLSLAPGMKDACPAGAIGANSPNPVFEAARVEAKTDARSAIDAFGFCRYPGNAGTGPLFVPFGNEEEWRAFQTNHPSTAYLTQCSRGGGVLVPPNFGHEAASNMCVTVPPVQFATAPYKPANVAGGFTAPPVTYDCKAADGTGFTEIATASLVSHDSGYGPSDDVGWTVGKVLYQYDGVCGAAKGVATEVAPTAGLCHVGVPSGVIGIGLGPFTWICAGGTGGGRNVTCSSTSTCQTRKVEEKPCRCEEGRCYRPVYWSDGCGKTWIDKSEICDAPEPQYAPEPPANVDDTNEK